MCYGSFVGIASFPLAPGFGSCTAELLDFHWWTITLFQRGSDQYCFVLCCQKMSHSLSSQESVRGVSWPFFCAVELTAKVSGLHSWQGLHLPCITHLFPGASRPAQAKPLWISLLPVLTAAPAFASAPSLGDVRAAQSSSLSPSTLSLTHTHINHRNKNYTNPLFQGLEIKGFPQSFSNLKQEDRSFLGHLLETWFFSYLLAVPAGVTLYCSEHTSNLR